MHGKMLDVLIFLPRNEYKDDAKLIYKRKSKQLIRKNVLNTNELIIKLNVILVLIFW